MNLTDNNRCFGCGKENPLGLKIAFTLDREKKAISGEFTPCPEHQGYQGITHGGIIATLLDEAMGRLLFELGIYAVTAWMEVRYKSPLSTGERVFVSANIIKERNNFFEAIAEVVDSNGTCIATATGKLIRA
ncbi:MAG: PaaI family thioesterase [Nitrospirae bacterium]|nr:PaaI family thioesterase [Nitrospirota bacterium]